MEIVGLNERRISQINKALGDIFLFFYNHPDFLIRIKNERRTYD